MTKEPGNSGEVEELEDLGEGSLIKAKMWAGPQGLGLSENVHPFSADLRVWTRR